MNDNNLDSNQSNQNISNQQSVNMNNQPTLGNIVNQSPLNQNLGTRSEYQNSLNQTIPTRSDYQNLNSVHTEEQFQTNPSTNNVNNATNIAWQNPNESTQSPYPLPTNEGNVPPVPPVMSTNISQNEIDDSFVEPKKKPIAAIILVILLIILLGGGVAYYFVIDNPKTLFINGINDYLNSNIENKIYDKFNAEYTLNLNIDIKDETYKEIFDITNKFRFSGNIGYDGEGEQTSIILNSTYDNNSLPSIQVLQKDKDYIYIAIKEIFDKTIKIEIPESEDIEVDTDIEDYQIVIDSFVNNLKETLKTANYTKEYTKLNEQLVKKVSLNIDKKFMESFFTKLLNDEKFIESYAKITETTYSEVSDDLNYELSNLEEDKVEIISFYLGIINNEFIMFEDNAGEDYQIKVIKSNEKYIFEYTENYTLLFEGYVILKNPSDKDISLTVELKMLEEETTIKIDLTTKIDDSKGIDEIDTTDSVILDEITEDEMLSIMEKLFANEAIANFLEDTELDSLLGLGKDLSI